MKKKEKYRNLLLKVESNKKYVKTCCLISITFM